MQAEVALDRGRVLDYVALTKPELTLLSVATMVAGLYLGTEGSLNVALMLHAFLGTLLVGSGAGALNQYLERDYDALMRRTENRPLPAGRLLPVNVLLFGLAMSAAGIAELLIFTNVLTAFLAILTLVSYLLVYTPLKRITPLSTVIGGIPGALPPMMGWTAVRNDISLEAWILFTILFLWQMPHFFSLAWMYRKDYARAGFPMLSVSDATGVKTSIHIVCYCLALVPAAVMPSVVGLSGMAYLVSGSLLGAGFLACSVLLLVSRTNTSARRVFFASLVYLPLLFAVMGMDKL